MRRLALILPLLPLPALAQPYDPVMGIAFVQAPEQYSGIATGTDPARVFAAAMADCTAAGALAEDCQIMSWCQPAGWSIDLFVQHNEGIHWHQFHCGLPDRATAERVAEAICTLPADGYLIECAMVQLYDADGLPQMK